MSKNIQNKISKDNLSQKANIKHSKFVSKLIVNYDQIIDKNNDQAGSGQNGF